MISHDEKSGGDQRIASVAGDADDIAVAKTEIDAQLASAINAEHNLTIRQAVKLYAKALAWSAYVSIGVIMLSFDPQLIGNLFAMGQFKKDFGVIYNGDYIIPASWQTGLSMGNPIGQVVGALFAAYPMDYFGRKATFTACIIATAASVFIQFFSPSLPVLLAGELISGLILGQFVVIAPAYASEVCPMALRGHLTSFVNLCFVIGQLLGNGVTAATQSRSDHWAYKIPFLLQWFWIIVLLPGIPFIPESPWWYVRKGRLQDAEKSLTRLASSVVDVKGSLKFIIEIDRLEQEMEAGSTYRDVFNKNNRRRTEISTGVYCTQVLSGIYLINYGTVFFQQAGLPDDQAFNMSIGFLAIGFVGTLVSWVLMVYIGRRPLYVWGQAFLTIIMLLVGVLDCIPGRPSSAIWAQSTLLLVWNFCFDVSIGPICYVFLGECSAMRVRSKTIATATAAQGTIGIIMTVAIPYMINEAEANMRGKIGFVFGGLGLLCFIWAYLRVPETKDRTYEELDMLFDKGISAREFKNYKLDAMSHE